MENNICRDDLNAVIDFLKEEPILTQSSQVKAFEKEWSEWLGVKHSVFLNSGSSANQLTMAALMYLKGKGEIIVPTLTWVSDIASVIQSGFTPVFVDIDPDHLGMSEKHIFEKITDDTVAVFLTHVQGFSALSDNLLRKLQEQDILLIEDVCESHGATHNKQKVGSFGFASNFSFYYAHHMSTIEGGMICTNDDQFYQAVRMGRSHGMVRECNDESQKNKLIEENPLCNPEFIFAYPAFNFRNHEIGAVIGRNQLKKLDANNEKRNRNHRLFLELLDSKKYKTDFKLEGSSNYAFNLIINNADPEFCSKVMESLRNAKVEYRRGSAGGGNQLRQPFLKDIVSSEEYKNYPNVEHVHTYGFYIGNFPTLEEARIRKLCELLNSIE